MNVSFAVASWLRMSSARIPPPTKKSRLVETYSAPIRLWSVVTSQLAKRPSYQAGRSGTAGWLAATCRPEARLEIRDQLVLELRVPGAANGGHLSGAVLHEVAKRFRILERRARRDRGADEAFALHAVARGAHSHEDE